MDQIRSRTIDAAKLDLIVSRAIGDLSAGYGGVMVSIGHRLGLYKAMAEAGPISSHQLAARTGCAERYIREWLGSQVAGGYVIYDVAGHSYELPAENAMVLAQDDSPVFMAAAWAIPASMWADEDKALEAFRTGAGIPWGDHDGRLYCGVASLYRNAYKASLISEWLPALDGVVEKLKAGALVADVGCGHGHSTALMAAAFPASHFRGFDSHAESLDEARQVVAKVGGTENVTFETARADAYPGSGYDLICLFDCLHDMGNPPAVADHAAKTIAANGTVMLVEPFAKDGVGDNISPVARMYYAASTTICCAHAISDGGHMVLGAQAGEKRLAEIFRKAGFTRFRRAMATPFNLVLEARL
jgi:SAM-dependent methyltransferase